LYLVPPSVASSEDAAEGEVPGGGALMVAVRAADLVRPAGQQAGGRSALTVAGTGKIRTGDLVAFCKVVLVAPAQVRRRGQVQAQGSPCDHATLGPLEERLDAAAGQGVIDGIADGVQLAGPVKGKRKRLLTTAFVLRAIVLMTLMPDADAREVVLALAGDLALVPWARQWRPASPRAFGDWRRAAGPEPLDDLPRAFRTADLRLIHAAICCSRYSSWTCCGVRYWSPECRRLELYQNSMYLTTSRYA